MTYAVLKFVDVYRQYKMSKVILLTLLGVAMAGWWTPEQISLSWTENENEMRATWVTLWWVPKTWIAYRPILCDTD